MLTDREQKVRLIHLCGITGSGKTRLVKEAVNYCFQRGFFMSHASDRSNVIFRNFAKHRYFFMFEEVMHQGFENAEALMQSKRNSSSLFIFDNCDSYFIKYFEQFRNYLLKLLNETLYLKFIVVSNYRRNLHLDEFCLNLEPLSTDDARECLLFQIDQGAQQPPGTAELERLLALAKNTPLHLSRVAKALQQQEVALVVDQIEADLKE